MKEINLNDLELVIGGARAVAAARRTDRDAELQMVLLRMQSDLKEAQQPQQNQMAMMTFAMAAMAMSRNRFA